MPTVRVETNMAFESFPPQFMTLFVYFLADLFGKDKDLMKYVFDTDKRMSMVRCELIHNTEQGPDNVEGLNGHFFWVDISLFDLFEDPEYCREVMPKIFDYLTQNSNLGPIL